MIATELDFFLNIKGSISPAAIKEASTINHRNGQNDRQTFSTNLSGTSGISEATRESAVNAACFPATTENKAKQVQVLPAHHSFDGSTFQPEHDQERLGAQLQRVKKLMEDGNWRTLSEISEITGDQPQAVSARLRDFRKEKFGGHCVERRRRGAATLGLFEYSLREKGGVI